MKKLLSLLGAVTLIGSSGSATIAFTERLSTTTNPAQDIANKITNKKIALPAVTYPDTTKLATIKVMKTALQTANPKLTNLDLQAITFRAVRLKDNEQANAVTAIIKVKGDTASVLLTVSIHSTVDQIKAKLESTGRMNITFVSTITNLTQTNPATILKAFKANNPQLSAWDQAHLTIITTPSVQLTLATRVDVTLNITDDARGTATSTLHVARFNTNTTDQYNAFKIADKIASSAVLALPALSDPNLPASTNALRQVLQTTNPTLTSADLAKITFSGPDLKPAEINNQITAKITVNQTSTSLLLTKVQIHRSTLEIEKDMTFPGKTLVVVPAGTNPSVTNPDTQQALREAIKNAYHFSDYDVRGMTFPKGFKENLIPNEQSNRVKVIIRDDASPTELGTVVLWNVQIHRTKDSIKSVIEAIRQQKLYLPGTGGITGKYDMDQRIKTEIQRSSWGQLSDWDIAQIRVQAKVAINSKQYTKVNLFITDDASPLTVTQTVYVESAK